MDTTGNDLLEILLRECARTAPEPVYPSLFSEATSVPRPQIDAAFDLLRLGGLVRLTDWVAGRGQGYTVTPEGAEVVQTPRLLERLRTGGVAPQPARPALRPAVDVRTSSWERGEAVRQGLLEPRRPVVTVVLIFLILLVFLAGIGLSAQRKIPINRYLAMERDPQVAVVLHDLGAVSYVDVLAREQWWRLIAHLFVHIGLIHLLLNGYALYSIGPFAETLWGPVRYAGLYLTAGLGGGCAIVLTKSAGAGASGAICGILASLIVWVAGNREHLPPQLASAWLRNLMVNAVLITVISFLPGISWQGHLGGAVAGAAFALPSLWEGYRRGWRRWAGLAGMVAVPALCVASLLVVVSPWERFKTVWPHVDNSLVEAFKHAKDYLKNPNEFPNDKELVNDALAQFARTRELLERARTHLERASPAGREEVVKDAKACIDVGLVFLQTLEDLMQRRRELTEAVQQQLLVQRMEIIEKILRLRQVVG